MVREVIKYGPIVKLLVALPVPLFLNISCVELFPAADLPTTHEVCVVDAVESVLYRNPASVVAVVFEIVIAFPVMVVAIELPVVTDNVEVGFIIFDVRVVVVIEVAQLKPEHTTEPAKLVTPGVAVSFWVAVTMLL
jgi:hypothetical protein